MSAALPDDAGMPTPNTRPPSPPASVRVGTIDIMALSEADVAERVATSWVSGRGGSIVTANVDIVRAASLDPTLTALVAEADLVVADGMPVVWAARLAGSSVPERVAGSSLVFSLSAVAANADRSVYLLGGAPGIPEAAAGALADRYSGLRIAGTDSPPLGFDLCETAMSEVTRKVVDAQPDLVFVGLGFPKQERVIRELRKAWPTAWYVGCGAGIPMAAGEFRRAYGIVQKMGAEWIHRLVLEPRRLAKRYLLHGVPFALRLLAVALWSRFRPAPKA